MESDLFTSSPEGSPASLGPSPGSDGASRMTAISGRKCFESWPRRDRDGSLGRMSQALLTWKWASTECYLTWGARATRSGYSIFRLAPSMPRTDANGSGLWLTHPVSSGAQTAGNPTPGQTGGTTLEGAARRNIWATPRASKAMNHGKAHHKQEDCRLEDQAAGTAPKPSTGGALAPEFVEWLQGFPLGWTELPSDWKKES